MSLRDAKGTPRRPAPCHPDRELYARAKCWMCYRRDNPTQRRAHLKKTFDMTLEEYDALLEAQGGVCAICGNPETRQRGTVVVNALSVDHDHGSGKRRALLCDRCNRRIHPGDTPELFEAFAAYLRRFA